MTMQSLKLLAATVIGVSALMSTPAFAKKPQRAPVAADCGANSDPAACRKETLAAGAAAKKGQLTSGDLTANQLARCDSKSMPAGYRETCRARIQNGQTSGSVAGGGTITEYREMVEVKP